MSTEVQLAVIAVVSTVVSGCFALLGMLLKSTLATNRELTAMARALREAMVSLGQRLNDVHARQLEDGELLEDLHRKEFGTKRTYAIRRSSPPPAAPDDGAPTVKVVR